MEVKSRLSNGCGKLQNHILACSITGNWDTKWYNIIRLHNKSRMNREAHVRFCEKSGVEFPWLTRLETVFIQFSIVVK